MGQSLNPFATHEPVPDDVKEAVPPVDFTPCSPGSMQTGAEVCEDCGEAFGWFSYSTNCGWCGRQLCTRCCPERHLLKGCPGCQECTAKAYRIRRAAMLDEHYKAAGLPNKSRSGAPAVTTSTGRTTCTTDVPSTTPEDAV